MKPARFVFSSLLPIVLVSFTTAASAMPEVGNRYHVSSQICFQAGLACMGGSCIEARLKRYVQGARRAAAYPSSQFKQQVQ